MRGLRRRGPTTGVAGAALLLLALLAAAARAPEPARATGHAAARAVPGEIIVGFGHTVSPRERAQLLGGAGAREQTSFRLLNAVVARSAEPAKAIAQLDGTPGVRYAQRNYILRADATPSDPLFTQEWGLDNTGQVVGFVRGTPGADIHAKNAWSVTTGSPNVTVAVVDTGIDFSHPDLAPNVWINPGENCPGCRTDGIDNDHNGYVDDWRGWDFHNHDNNPSDDNGHGTHVAGIIGAVGNNGIGVAGVNWNVKIMPLKFLGSDGSGTTADAMQAIQYAAQNGAAILNNSYGGPDADPALSDAIGFADASRALFVASAGNSSSDNDATPTYPSSDPHANVVSVAATTSQDQLAWFSNYGRGSVDLGAPGDSIESTWTGGGYAMESGTSMAAPYVAGTAALAKAAFPAATGVGLKALLLRTVNANASLAGRTTSGGRLNADGAVHCSGAQAWVEAPAPGFTAAVGGTVNISAIGTQCGDPRGATVTATANGATVSLTARGDGLYTGTYSPTTPGPIRITVSASSATGTDSKTIAGQVPTPIVPGGSPVTVSTTTPGETPLLSFAGSAGQRVSLQMSNVTMNVAVVTLLKPDGTALGATTYVGTAGAFVDTRVLPNNGTYMVVVAPQNGATGSMTLTLYNVPPDVNTPITPGGPSVTVTTTTPGQNAQLTFAGTAGQRVSLALGNVTMNVAVVTLLKPDGTALGAATYVGAGGTAFVDTRVLPTNGTYTVLIDPYTTATGNITLTLYNVPPDVNTPITPGGPSVTVTATKPGQNAQLTFAGTAGQRVSLQLSNVTMNLAVVTLLKPDGTALGSATYAGSGGGFVDTRVLPTNGTYTLLVDPYGTATGSITLTLYNVPPDVNTTITPGGPNVTITTTTPGQNAQLTFAGTAGQRVSLQLSNVTMTVATVTMLAPDGTALGGTAYAGSGGAFVDTRVLPSTGTYTLIIDPQSAYVGSITLTLYNVPPDVTASITPGGAPVTITTATPGQNAQLTFAGTAGQALSLQFSGVTIPASSVSVTGPDGKYVLSPSTIFTFGATFNLALPLSGTYTIAVDPQFAYVGSMTLKLT